MLTSALKPTHDDKEKWSKSDRSNMPLLRPQDIRIAIMASEKLLILQPHNWALRRDHGMMLYYSRTAGHPGTYFFLKEFEAKVIQLFMTDLKVANLEKVLFLYA